VPGESDRGQQCPRHHRQPQAHDESMRDDQRPSVKSGPVANARDASRAGW
jgi:hypothetical protein